VPGAVLDTWRVEGLVGLFAEAFGNSNELVSGSLELLDSVRQDLVDGGLVGLVIKSENGRGPLADGLIINLLATSDSSAKRVLRVHIPDNEGLATGGRGLPDEVVLVTIGRAHESWGNTDDLLESLFNSPHFIVNFVPAKGSQI